MLPPFRVSVTSRKKGNRMKKAQNPIYFITPEEALEIVKIWQDHPERNNDLYIAEAETTFVAIDNTSGDCFTEEFKTLTEAIKWLLEE